MPALGPLVARGRTAEVFAYGEGRVLKLLLVGRTRGEVEREASIGRLVQQVGLPAPAIYETVEIDGRFGVVFERIDGPSMLDVLMAKPWRVTRLAPQLGELHARIHRVPISSDSAALRALPAELRRKIGQVTNLSDGERSSALDQLAALERASPDRRLAHGDFHPANVILSQRGPIIVDWNDATLGPPAADVARTEVLLLRGTLPPSMPVRQRLMIHTLRRLFYALYLRRYRSLTRLSTSGIAAWRLSVTTARRAEGVEQE